MTGLHDEGQRFGPQAGNCNERSGTNASTSLSHLLTTGGYIDQWRLQGVGFRWRDATKDAEYGRVSGMIAQDVENVIPEWIKTDPDGDRRIEPIGEHALLIEAIKEQQTEMEKQHKESEALREMIKSLVSEKEVGNKTMGQLK